MDGGDDLQDAVRSAWADTDSEHQSRTSTAPCTSAPVLHFPNPSITAPTASSTYFSSVRVCTSFSIAGTLAAVCRDDRRRVSSAVCRLRDGSSFPSEAAGAEMSSVA